MKKRGLRVKLLQRKSHSEIFRSKNKRNFCQTASGYSLKNGKIVKHSIEFSNGTVLANPTKRDFAYQCILSKITSESLAPGTPMREDHLAEEFGISATPIREALRRLELEGWLQSQPNCGFSIRSFSAEEISELFVMREVYEGAAAALAAENATQEDIDSISVLLEDSEKIVLRKIEEDKAAFLSVKPPFDLDFHDLIFQAAHSSILSERYKASQGQLKLLVMFGTSQPYPVQDMKRVLEEHQMIFHAIKRHWADAAELLIRRHISAARVIAMQSVIPVKRRKKK